METRGKRFICEICGKPHYTPIERARCVIKCTERKEKEIAERETKRKCRVEEIQRLNNKLDELIISYQKDYKEPIFWI